MAQFYGEVQGKAKTTAHRLGSRNSGLRVVAASWQGAVEVYLSNDSQTGKDIASVFLTPWHGHGTTQALYVGPVDGRDNTIEAGEEGKVSYAAAS